MISKNDFENYHNIRWMFPDSEALGASVLIPKGYELEMFSDHQFW
jgi:hypothetical protein